MTWAIFSDKTPAGRVERRYITDVIVRPRPLVVAGRLKRYSYEFTAHRFEMTLTPDATLGSTEIFLPRDRHYSKGFRVEVGPDLTLALDPDSAQLRILKTVTTADRNQAELIRWDNNAQRLFFDQWVTEVPTLKVRILPLNHR